jgi:hypothetical protein
MLLISPGDEMILLLLILIAWEAYWTYKACWEAAQSNAKGWFIVFLLVNLLGIPEIVYLAWKRRQSALP